MTADRLLSHLIRALAEHERWLTRQGLAAPAELVALKDGLQALSGPARPISDGALLPADPPPVRLLGEVDVARLLSVSERTVRRLQASGELPSVLIGRARRFAVEDVDRYVASLRGAA